MEEKSAERERREWGEGGEGESTGGYCKLNLGNADRRSCVHTIYSHRVFATHKDRTHKDIYLSLCNAAYHELR